MLTIHGHDNGTHFYSGRNDVERCPVCGEILNKWECDVSKASVPKSLKYDFSASYDGAHVASQAFRDFYMQHAMTGLEFRQLRKPGHWWVMPERTVAFDHIHAGTRFEDRCSRCGQFESVVGIDPFRLRAGEEVAPLEFARTDLEFASNDEKSPVFICGSRAGELLLGSNLRGFHGSGFDPV